MTGGQPVRRSSARLTPQLQLVKPLIQPLLRQELPVASPLADLPVLQHQNLVRMQDRAQPVGDHQAGAARS